MIHKFKTFNKKSDKKYFKKSDFKLVLKGFLFNFDHK